MIWRTATKMIMIMCLTQMKMRTAWILVRKIELIMPMKVMVMNYLLVNRDSRFLC